MDVAGILLHCTSRSNNKVRKPREPADHGRMFWIGLSGCIPYFLLRMSECLRDGCTNERMDARGSLGLYCSKECLAGDKPDSTINIEGLAEDIANQ